jgi:hypothetical protein
MANPSEANKSGQLSAQGPSTSFQSMPQTKISTAALTPPPPPPPPPLPVPSPIKPIEVVDGEGKVFRGEVVDGNFIGVGVTSGQRYKGGILENMFHGHGELVDSTFTLTGWFVKGKVHGLARQVSENFVYTGAFLEDEWHGRGKLEWPDGGSYEGKRPSITP